MNDVDCFNGLLMHRDVGRKCLIILPRLSFFSLHILDFEAKSTNCLFFHFQVIFKDSMLLQFVNVFLQALVYRSHDLLQEEITITLYNMAAVDFDSFYSAFLPQFLGGCEGLTDTQKSELGKNFTGDKVSTVEGHLFNFLLSKLLINEGHRFGSRMGLNYRNF